MTKAKDLGPNDYRRSLLDIAMSLPEFTAWTDTQKMYGLPSGTLGSQMIFVEPVAPLQ
jgi:hypothetical protein